MQCLSYLSLLVSGLCVVSTGLTDVLVAGERVTPRLGGESTALVGEAILHQGIEIQRAAIHLSEEIKFGEDGAYALTPGYYFRTSQNVGWEYYAPGDGPGAGSLKKAPGAITVQGSFHYSNDGKTIGMITNFYQAVNADAKGIMRTTRPALSPFHLQRSLVYGGKSGSKIKLAYREVLHNISRPSGDVFVAYDLADSKIIEIRGARIEVIKADKKSIRYRVTGAFKE